MNASCQLLNSIVDYAGLFPPASLDLETVVVNYDRYRQSDWQWMLGRLIIPASRLSELQSVLSGHQLEVPWSISALLPPLEGELSASTAFLEGVAAIDAFHASRASSQHPVVDAVEIRADSVDQIRAICETLDTSIAVFAELDWRHDPGDALQTLAKINGERGNRFAKIRTGGVTPDLIPSAEDVARFILACARQQVGFKATAGLHHPLRSEFRLTYESDAPTGTMHGFVNLFVGSCLVFGGQISSPTELITILECRVPAAFVLTPERIGFDRWSLEAEQVAEIRNRYVTSFGSCSFEEPSEEIQQRFPLLTNP